jgi:hypothetical protein
MANWGSSWFRKMARQKQMVFKMARQTQMVSKMSGNPSVCSVWAVLVVCAWDWSQSDLRAAKALPRKGGCRLLLNGRTPREGRKGTSVNLFLCVVNKPYHRSRQEGSSRILVKRSKDERISTCSRDSMRTSDKLVFLELATSTLQGGATEPKGHLVQYKEKTRYLSSHPVSKKNLRNLLHFLILVNPFTPD